MGSFPLDLPRKGGPIFWRGVASLLFDRPRNKPAASMTFNCDRVVRQLFPLLRQVQVYLPDVGSGAARAARWHSTAFLRQASAFAVAHRFHSVAFANKLNRPCPPALVRLTQCPVYSESDRSTAPRKMTRCAITGSRQRNTRPMVLPCSVLSGE